MYDDFEDEIEDYEDEEWKTCALCGGEFIHIGKVSIGYCDVDAYECSICGKSIDATDYECFEEYQLERRRKGYGEC